MQAILFGLRVIFIQHFIPVYFLLSFSCCITFSKKKRGGLRYADKESEIYLLSIKPIFISAFACLLGMQFKTHKKPKSKKKNVFHLRWKKNRQKKLTVLTPFTLGDHMSSSTHEGQVKYTMQHVGRQEDCQMLFLLHTLHLIEYQHLADCHAS